MEVGGANADDHQQHPDHVNAGVDEAAVLSKQVDQHRRHQKEQHVAQLKQNMKLEQVLKS